MAEPEEERDGASVGSRADAGTLMRAFLGRRPTRFDSTPPPPAIRTEFPATVFSGEPSSWIAYLAQPRAQRYEPVFQLRVLWSEAPPALFFEPQGDAALPLAELLNGAFDAARRQLLHKPYVLKVLEDLIFENRSNQDPALAIRLSASLPCSACREATLDAQLEARSNTIVLSTSLVESSLRRVRDNPGRPTLGVAWSLFSRLVAQLAYPARPRDRFVEKIKTMSKHTYVMANLLYEKVQGGRLVPTALGECFEDYVTERDGIPRSQLFLRHPYFKLLREVCFVLRGGRYRTYGQDVRIAVREYLDDRALRLSLAGMMPEPLPGRVSMGFERRGSRILTPGPQMGRYGLVDKEDMQAWKRVARPLRKLGFTLLGQLGIGEFGRVYDALNESSPHLPERVAIKIDRITGSTKRAILSSEATMRLSRQLAPAVHVIRVYDAGKLAGADYTYHVLQRVDGDTLDTLVGVAGLEHRSIHQTVSHAGSTAEALERFRRVMQQLSGQPHAVGAPFIDALSPAMTLDLVTSVLLWLEEAHACGYAINDVKNGNIMLNRRGQLKGIDVDAYSPVRSPRDKLSDFLFLSVSLLLLFYNAPLRQRHPDVPWQELFGSPKKLRAGLAEAWREEAFDKEFPGQPERDEVLDLFTELITRSRDRTYCRDPEVFSHDIQRVVELKYRAFQTDIVLD